MKNLNANLSLERDIIAEAEKIINQVNSDTYKKSKSKNTHKKTIIIISILFVIIILFLLSFIFGFITSKSNKIIHGVFINGVDVSNLNKDEALQKLNLQFSDNFSNELTLTHQNYSSTLAVSTLDANLNFDEAVNSAYNIGRTEDNIFTNNFNIIKTYFSKTNIIPALTVNTQKFNSTVDSINNELPDKLVNASYTIENDKLILTNSMSGYKINNNLFLENLQYAICFNNSTIDLPVQKFEATTIDINAVYNEIHKDPIDAYYSTNPYEIHKEEEGLDFAITLDEAQNIIATAQTSYEIPLKTLKPSITVKDLSAEAFPDMLASYSTSYASSNYNRSTNINLASNSVNGTVLMPDEVFSYNDTVGQRTPARGYKEAGVYLNGEVTTDYGGGICQVSSTLYNAVLLANLEIVERSNHTFKPTYVPPGQDATVSWGAPDFKFKNNRSYPIKIVSQNSNGNIFFYIYGLKSEDDYEVKIESRQIASIPPSTQYQEDRSLPYGTARVVQSGSSGCKTETYKILYKNGIEISRTLINSDTYKPHNQVIRSGTGR